jgi:two-component system response regulator ChvI
MPVTTPFWPIVTRDRFREMRKLKFAIVDDDTHVLFFAERVLRKGFPKSDIVTFTDGTEALEYLRSNHTDVLVTDHKMAHMDGAELIRELRNDGYTGPIVMVSNSPRAKEEGLAAGATAYLEKDPSMRGLPDVVRALLAESQPKGS